MKNKTFFVFSEKNSSEKNNLCSNAILPKQSCNVNLHTPTENAIGTSSTEKNEPFICVMILTVTK